MEGRNRRLNCGCHTRCRRIDRHPQPYQPYFCLSPRSRRPDVQSQSRGLEIQSYRAMMVIIASREDSLKARDEGPEVGFQPSAPSGVRPEAQGQLGRSSALDLQARLIAKGLRIPTIFVTAFPDATTRARAMNAG